MSKGEKKHWLDKGFVPSAEWALRRPIGAPEGALMMDAEYMASHGVAEQTGKLHHIAELLQIDLDSEHGGYVLAYALASAFLPGFKPKRHTKGVRGPGRPNSAVLGGMSDAQVSSLVDALKSVKPQTDRELARTIAIVDDPSLKRTVELRERARTIENRISRGRKLRRRFE